MITIRAARSWATAVAISIAIAALGASAIEVPTADAQTRSHRHRSRSRARAPRLTPAQRRQIQRWHARASTAEVRAWSRREPPPLVLLPLRGRARVTLAPASDEGGFDADDLALAQQALATRDGATREIHPRLIELVYRAVRHFRVPYVHVISGYREGRATSRHAQGRALDFVLPGVSDRRLSAWLRPQGFVGVGIYPTSGFVHLDVRARSYFWSDSSGPDQPNRERPMLATATSRYDAAARRGGAVPTPDLDVSAAGGEPAGESAALSAEDEARDVGAEGEVGRTGVGGAAGASGSGEADEASGG